jgi:hypothetical protein
MKNLRTHRFLCFLLLLHACTEEVDWQLDYQELDVLVVEGKVTNEARSHEVRITRPVYEQNGSPEGVSGLQVELNDRRGIHGLREDPGRPGIYLTAPDFAAEVEKGIQLRIRSGDQRITGVSFMREVGEFPPMNVYPVQQRPRLYEVRVSDQNGPAIIRMELDWSHVPGYETLPPEENHAVIYHYILGSVDVNRIFAPDKEQVRFPPGTIVFREMESVSLGYEEFLRGMLSETDWRGGVFDVQPGNARTNLSEGAIGFFTAAEVRRDTVVVQ